MSLHGSLKGAFQECPCGYLQETLETSFELEEHFLVKKEEPQINGWRMENGDPRDVQMHMTCKLAYLWAFLMKWKAST